MPFTQISLNISIRADLAFCFKVFLMEDLLILLRKSDLPFQLQKSWTVPLIQGFQHYWISEDLLISSTSAAYPFDERKILHSSLFTPFHSFSTDHRSDENPPLFKPPIAPNSLESGKLTGENCRKRKARIFNIELHIGTKCCLWCLRDNVTPTERFDWSGAFYCYTTGSESWVFAYRNRGLEKVGVVFAKEDQYPCREDDVSFVIVSIEPGKISKAKVEKNTEGKRKNKSKQSSFPLWAEMFDILFSPVLPD